MTQGQINNAIRSLAYLKNPDAVRAGVRNTYGYNVKVERVERILSVLQSEGARMMKVPEPKACDAFDYDYRLPSNPWLEIVRDTAPEAAPEPAITQPVIHPELSENPYAGPFVFKQLTESVAKEMYVRAADILGPNRARHLILARAILSMLCLKQGMSCKLIGRRMGGRDHSTIINHRKAFPKYAAEYPEVLACYEKHLAWRDEVIAARAAEKLAA